MIFQKPIIGQIVSLRSVNIMDSDFIVKIRTDQKSVNYIHRTSNDNLNQIKYIKNQIYKENDYYFIIESIKEKKSLGTIGLYNIDKEMVGEMGRWICLKCGIGSLEALFLLYQFAFKEMSLKKVLIKTLESNHKALDFHDRYGSNRNNISEFDLELNQNLIIHEETCDHFFATYYDIKKKISQRILDSSTHGSVKILL